MFSTCSRRSKRLHTDATSVEGVKFPVDSTGRRATTGPAKRIFISAMGNDKEFAAEVNAEQDWRHSYSKYVMKVAEHCGLPERALSQARNGLAQVQKEFEFHRDGDVMSMEEAMQLPGSFHAHTIQGGGPAQDPVDGGGSQAILNELRAMVAKGSCEASVVTSLEEFLAHPEWRGDSLKQLVFVVLGATSEMGPLKPLLQLGACVVAVSRPSRKWDALIAYARTTAGSLVVPMANAPGPEPSDREVAQLAGADVLTKAPELARWLQAVLPERRMILGGYIYLDSDAHVRATVAMDAIITTVSAARHTALGFLVSPATAHPVPRECVEAAQARASARSWWTYPMGLTTGVRGFHPNARAPVLGPVAGEVDYHVHDGIAVVQGPNYVLAKTIQNWRCLLAHHNGQVVSANVTPPARTESVTHNRQVATALKGMTYFDPMSVFDASFVSPVMAWLLVYDVCSESSSAQPGTSLEHPWHLFWQNAWHGGSWRAAFTAESIGPAAYLLGFVARS